MHPTIRFIPTLNQPCLGVKRITHGSPNQHLVGIGVNRIGTHHSIGLTKVAKTSHKFGMVLICGAVCLTAHNLAAGIDSPAAPIESFGLMTAWAEGWALRALVLSESLMVIIHLLVATLSALESQTRISN